MALFLVWGIQLLGFELATYLQGAGKTGHKSSCNRTSTENLSKNGWRDLIIIIIIIRTIALYNPIINPIIPYIF